MVMIHKKKVESAEEKEARLQKEKEASMGLQDEYQAKGFELVSWVQENKTLVTAAIVIVFLACISFGGYVFYQKRAATLASVSYMEAMRTLEESESAEGEKDKNLQQAKDSLRDLALNFKGSNIAVLANIYAGHIALEKNDTKEAISLYERALGKISKTDELFPLVMVGLGYAYKTDGQVEKALANFEGLINNKGVSSKELALFEAASILVGNKEFDKANGYLARLIDEYPSSVYWKDAKRLKETLE